MSRIETDIFISGAGIAGLTAGISLARAGFSVVLADPSQPPSDVSDAGSDLRSTAFLRPARDLLENAGLWSSLAPHAMTLETLRVINLSGEPEQIAEERAFQSSDLDEPAFGWNLPNWLTRKILTGAARDTDGLELRLGTGFQSMLTRESEALITLTDKTRVRAKLAIAADGRASPLRDAAGIETKTTRYGQKALAFAVSHPIPHSNVSTELYHAGGAFVLVPLPNHNGKPASAVVWMHDGPEAVRLAALDDTSFAEAVTLRSAAVLGELTPLTPRRVWPVVTQRAEHLVAERTALIAEAAHVMPPIGAQGLNTSLHDVRALLDIAIQAPDQIGTLGFLSSYAKQRESDIRTRAHVIDFYNRLCRNDAAPVVELRSLGLRLIHDVAPLRKKIMQAGLGR